MVMKVNATSKIALILASSINAYAKKDDLELQKMTYSIEVMLTVQLCMMLPLFGMRCIPTMKMVCYLQYGLD